MRFKKLLATFWPTLFLPLLVACNKQEPAGFPHSLRPGELLPYLKELTWTNYECVKSATTREPIDCESLLDGYIYHYGHKLPISGMILYRAKSDGYFWSISWHHKGTSHEDTGVYTQCLTLPGTTLLGEIKEKTICLHPPA